MTDLATVRQSSSVPALPFVRLLRKWEVSIAGGRRKVIICGPSPVERTKEFVASGA